MAWLLPGVFILLLITSACDHTRTGAKLSKDSVNVYPSVLKTALWVDSGYFNRVKPFLDSVYRHHHVTSPRMLALKYERIGEIYYYHFKAYDTCETYIDSIGALINDKKSVQPNVNQILSYYFIKGNLAIIDKNYDEAFRYYYKGKQIIDQSPGSCGIQRYYNTLAHMFYRQEKFLDAAQYMMMSYESVNLCGSETRNKIALVQREALSNVGLCYENAGMYDSAIYYYNRALRYIEDNKQLFTDKSLSLSKFKGVILGNRGGTYFKMKLYDKAIEDFKESIAINYTENGEKGDAVLTKIKLADLYLETNKLKQFEELVVQLDTDVVALPYIIADMRFALLKHKYFNKKKNYQAALQYLNVHNALRDSIKGSSDFNIERHTDHVKEFHNLERSFELELVKSENERKNALIILAIIIVLMALVIMGMMLMRRTVNKKHINDLTELNKQVQNSNLKLTSSIEQLQKSEHENSRMIKIIAHDLRSPIAGIMSLVRMIRNDRQELNQEEFAEYMDLVEKAGANALSFIDEMLGARTGSATLVKTDVDIEDVLKSCLSIMQVQAEKKHQKITLESVSQIININEEKIWRLVNNIISNAFKFSPPYTTVEVKAYKVQDSVVISIKDEGIGIPDSYKDKMFSLFARNGREGTNGEQSFGLGLLISKQIVEAHKGKLWFESEPNAGTTFYIELPVS